MEIFPLFAVLVGHLLKEANGINKLFFSPRLKSASQTLLIQVSSFPHREGILVFPHFALACAVGEAQAFPESPAAFCVQTPSNFIWHWEGRTDPVPIRSSCEVCASQGDGLTNTQLKCKTPRCSSFWQAPDSQLVSDASALCWN